jgi:predicted nucleic acid-binding protein
MQADSDIIISDTSCLILLSKIAELDILRLMSNNVFITDEIRNEFGGVLPSWIIVKDPSEKHYQKILEMDLDKGEASAIALSFELDNTILILDDLKGRKIAEKLSLRYSGTFGLILSAKKKGVIKSVRPLLDKVRHTNFRFSETLFDTILRESGE